jgi:hypothetical protein
MSSNNPLTHFLLEKFPGLIVIKAWGETSFFFNPDGSSSRGTYFCTIKEKNGKNDQSSALDRPEIYRFSFALARATFLELFGSIPQRPPKGGIITGPHDFTQLDTLLPHPIYAWMCWVAILNPSEQSFSKLEGMLEQSYQLVVKKHRKKIL